MQISLSQFVQTVKSISEIFTVISKFSILPGGICVIFYLVRIGFFPQEASTGDGLLFIMVSACFGAIYFIIITSLISLGFFIFTFVCYILKLIIYLINDFEKQKSINISLVPILKQLRIPLAPLMISMPLLALYGIIFIIILGESNKSAYWGLPFISILLYFICLLCISHVDDNRKAKFSGKFTIKTEYELTSDQIEGGHFWLFIPVFIFIIPLFVAGVFEQLVNSTMRAVHIRIENSIVYIREPYSSLLPASLISKSQNKLNNFTAFNKVVVLFNGIGKTTLISFDDEGATKKLGVPNDGIIIEEKIKKPN